MTKILLLPCLALTVSPSLLLRFRSRRPTPTPPHQFPTRHLSLQSYQDDRRHRPREGTRKSRYGLQEAPHSRWSRSVQDRILPTKGRFFLWGFLPSACALSLRWDTTGRLCKKDLKGDELGSGKYLKVVVFTPDTGEALSNLGCLQVLIDSYFRGPCFQPSGIDSKAPPWPNLHRSYPLGASYQIPRDHYTQSTSAVVD